MVSEEDNIWTGSWSIYRWFFIIWRTSAHLLLFLKKLFTLSTNVFRISPKCKASVLSITAFCTYYKDKVMVFFILPKKDHMRCFVHWLPRRSWNGSINIFELMWQHHSVKTNIHWTSTVCPKSLLNIKDKRQTRQCPCPQWSSRGNKFTRLKKINLYIISSIQPSSY